MSTIVGASSGACGAASICIWTKEFPKRVSKRGNAGPTTSHVTNREAMVVFMLCVAMVILIYQNAQESIQVGPPHFAVLKADSMTLVKSLLSRAESSSHMRNWEWVQSAQRRPAAYARDQYADWQAVTDPLAERYGTKPAIPTDGAGIAADIDWEAVTDILAERYRIQSGISINDAGDSGDVRQGVDDRRQETVVAGEGFTVTLAMH
jgi:hypothetical protein